MNRFINPPKTPNNLQSFIHETRKSFIRQSGFEISITPPRALTYVSKVFDKIQFRAFSINTPATQIATADDYVEVNEYRKYAYDYSRGIVTVSFYIDGNYEIVRLFEEWKNAVINPRTRAIRFYDEYISDMYVDIVRKDCTIASKYRFREVFPKVINEISYDWSQNQTSVVTITFEYAYYDLIDAEGKAVTELPSLDSLPPVQLEDLSFLDTDTELSTDLITAPPGTEGEGTLSDEAVAIATAEALGDNAYEFGQTALNNSAEMRSSIENETEDLADSVTVANSIAKSAGDAAEMQVFTEEQLKQIEASYGIPESKEAAKELAADLSESAKETAEGAEKVKTKSYEDAEKKFGDAADRVTGAIKKFENRKKEAEKAATKFANGLDEINKLANILDTAKGIEQSIKDFSSLSKAVKLKNKFQAIKAAKSSSSALGRTVKGSRKITKDILSVFD